MSTALLLENEALMFTLTLGAFLVGKKLFARTTFPILNPLLTAVGLIVGVLWASGIEYEQYREQTRFIHFLVGPAVVALGLVLYEQIGAVKLYLKPVLICCFVGSWVAIGSVSLICWAFNADPSVLASLQPKSVTTAIALGIADKTGGIPALTAIAVILTGIFGALFSPLLFRALKIKSERAQGLSLGAASHVMGTSKAVELGPTQAAFAGLAVGIMGTMTALFVPLFNRLLSVFEQGAL